MAARKQRVRDRREKEPEQNISFKVIALVMYFLHLGPTS
jgi:hypothetical protein